MNPPSALFGAMNRERKPFTYTPGGLDLSEIKSERMAKRLMRNAMNQGVPEVPVQTIQSPPAQLNSKAIPNFNCLPVQVFPTMNLPANPKSLLRTRSNPEHPRGPPVQRIPPPSHFENNTKLNDPDNSTPIQSQSSNINSSQARAVSMYDYSIPSNTNVSPRTNYGSDGSTIMATASILPEINYEAEYCQAIPKNNNGFLNNNVEIDLIKNNEKASTDITMPINNENSDIKNTEENIGIQNCDFIIEPISNLNRSPAPTTEIAVTKFIEDEAATNNEQREVKVVKKQVKKEKKIENGDQNGETNIEAADLTVKLPTKKSAAKTETKVEVQKTILPDGTVEEVKITTTKTTIDGKTEIKTKTEKTIIPKEETEEVEEEEEEEENEAEEESEVVEEPVVIVKKTVSKETPVENGQKETIVKKEERSETSTTKKVVVVQKEESEEEEEEEEEEPVVVVKKSVAKPSTPKQEVEEENEEVEKVVEKSQQVVRTTEPVKEKKVEEEAEEEVEEVEEKVERKIEAPQKSEPPKQEEEKSDEEVEEEYEEAEDKVEKVEQKVVKEEVVKESKKQEDEESEYTEEEYESEKEDSPKDTAKVADTKPQEPEKEEPKEKIPEQQVEKPEPKVEKEEPLTPQPASEPAPQPAPQPVPQPASQPSTQPAQKVLREPSIPLEKVEDVEIKPIGATSGLITKSHTENTEIITSSSQQPKGPLSTQTEYNRVENIVTVNRTTKTLDHSYDQITQTGIPTLKTYFAPNRERISTSPQPSKPYQPVYAPEQTTERRHSLLLDRLSVERQAPSSDIYQNTYQYNTNQSYEQQRQWNQEPQSEVINVSNVKPSKITNQQWYQQNNRDNVIYNNVTPSAGAPAATSQPWSQSVPQPSQQYQPSYIDNTTQEKVTTNTYQQNNYPTYIPKPTNWVNSNVDNLPSINTNKYSFLDTSENYQKSTTQQYSSTYVPPPWEQDPNYVLNTSNQNYYQPPPQPTTYSPSSNQGWKSAPPQAKYTKPPPTSYIPPAPNQSFVKSPNIIEPPKIPGRKTYYSEYERRYITVPESTYIPGQTKFQAQPDPSPQYYYDNNEPSEKVEHEWRKELREFTEKTSQTTQHTTEQTSVLPPWEEDPKYVKTPSAYTPTPTWSQTLRPRSCRERSFESEYVGSQEFSKTNTLGRGRPLSSYGKEPPIPERVRGVSVDRYNPNNYQSPLMSEHGPVPTHTLTPTPPAKSYHNPNVPAYHTHPRASAEPREQPASYQQPRLWGVDSRGTPVQSRSFKYLQWITGTED